MLAILHVWSLRFLVEKKKKDTVTQQITGVGDLRIE